MAIFKKIVAGKMETIDTCGEGKVCPCKCSFRKGVKFSMEEGDWIVSEERNSDNTDFRTITNIRTGDTKVVTLNALVQDVQEGIVIVKNG